MRTIMFKITLICFFAVSVFARAGDGFAAHSMQAEATGNAPVAIEVMSANEHDPDTASKPCACKETQGSQTSITCGVVLALPTDSLKLAPPMAETEKLQMASRYGFKLFLPIQKKPPRC